MVEKIEKREEDEDEFRKMNVFQVMNENAVNKWERVVTFGDTFPPRSGHTSILHESTSRIYTFGGFTGTEVLNDLFYFDLLDSSWHQLLFTEEALLTYPKPRTSHAACFDTHLKDKFYLFGGSGKNIGQENYNDLWVFDFTFQGFREVLQGK